jgi:hypothetical protein
MLLNRSQTKVLPDNYTKIRRYIKLFMLLPPLLDIYFTPVTLKNTLFYSNWSTIYDNIWPLELRDPADWLRNRWCHHLRLRSITNW